MFYTKLTVWPTGVSMLYIRTYARTYLSELLNFLHKLLHCGLVLCFDVLTQAAKSEPVKAIQQLQHLCTGADLLKPSIEECIQLVLLRFPSRGEEDKIRVRHMHECRNAHEVRRCVCVCACVRVCVCVCVCVHPLTSSSEICLTKSAKSVSNSCFLGSRML